MAGMLSLNASSAPASSRSSRRDSANSALEPALTPRSDVATTLASPPKSDKMAVCLNAVSRAPSSRTHAPPLPLLSSARVVWEENESDKMNWANESSLRDTTVLSDISDEIQKVEARLLAIREEEAQLVPKRTAPAAPTRPHNGVTGGTDAVSMECGTLLRTVPGRTSFAGLENPPWRQGSSAEATDGSLAAFKSARSLLEKGIPYQSPVLSSTDSRGLDERFSDPVNTPAEPPGVFFSLATFLSPVCTVDVEIAAGVYEKLEIFAGEDMAEVARRFIEKHKLDPSRAFKPLHAFLKSLIENKKSSRLATPRDHSTDIVHESKIDNNSDARSTIIATAAANTTTTTNNNNTGGRGRRSNGLAAQYTLSGAPNCRMASARKGGSVCTTPREREAVACVPLHPANPILSRKAQRLDAGSLGHDSVIKTLNVVEEGNAPTCPDRSGRMSVHEREKERRNVTPARGCENNVFVRCNGGDVTGNGSRDLSSKKATSRAGMKSNSLTQKKSTSHPEVVAVEIEVTGPGVKERIDDVGSQGRLWSRASQRASQCSSTKPHRAASGTRTRRSTTLHDEVAPPTFKPQVAPRSELLAAQDVQRSQGGPTYARLHARTPRILRASAAPPPPSSSSAAAAAAAECTGIPRILPYKRNDSRQDPIGQRLYEQAIDQQRRMQEKRVNVQQQRDEEERRLLTSGPNINRRRRCRLQSREDRTRKCTQSTTRTHSADAPQRRASTIKSREEKELESCTFAPVINPASVRMFNMVVKGHAAEGAMAGETNRERNRAEQETAARGQACNNGPIGDVASVEDRLMLLERKRRNRLQEERFFRETVDVRTGRPLFRPFLGR